MADICSICGERKPTNHLVLNEGSMWIEFCKKCGEIETLTNQHGETYTLEEIFYNIPERNKKSNEKTNDNENTNL